MKAKVSGIVIVKLMPSSSCKLKLYSVCVKNRLVQQFFCQFESCIWYSFAKYYMSILCR